MAGGRKDAQFWGVTRPAQAIAAAATRGVSNIDVSYLLSVISPHRTVDVGNGLTVYDSVPDAQATTTLISYSGNTIEKSLLTLQAAVLQANYQPFAGCSTVTWPARTNAPVTANTTIQVSGPLPVYSSSGTGSWGSNSGSVTSGGTLQIGGSSMPPAKPTGVVNFYDSGALLGSGTIDASGIASLSLSVPLAYGPHPITARYLGTTAFTGSTSYSYTIGITHGATATTLTASAATYRLGDTVTLTAATTTTENQKAGLTGKIKLMSDTKTLATMNVGGSFTLLAADLTYGVNHLVAVYQDDSIYGGSTAPPLTLTVAGTSTITDVSYWGIDTERSSLMYLTAKITRDDGHWISAYSSWPATPTRPSFVTAALKVSVPYLMDSTGTIISYSYCGDASFGSGSVTIHTIHGWYPPPAIPTGTVSFYDGATLLGTGTIYSDGNASFKLPAPLAYGPHQITAVYSGDQNFVGSTSLAHKLNITHGATTTALTVPAGTITAGSLLTLVAQATTTENERNWPTGQFTFFDGSHLLGTVAGGATNQLVWPMTVGVHTLTVLYSGDDNFSRSAISSTVYCGVTASTPRIPTPTLTGNLLKIHTLVGRGSSFGVFTKIG